MRSGRQRFACLVALAGAWAAPAGQQPGAVEAATRSFERQVVENIQEQALGDGTVRDLDLPDAFLATLADHEIRESFYREHQRIYRDVADIPRPATAPGEASASSDWIGIHRVAPAAEVLLERRSFEPGRPELRGFRAPLFDHAVWPLAPDADAPEPVRRARAVVAAHLASDGLLTTLTRVVEALGPAGYEAPDDAALRTLVETGFPLDLLEFFPVRPDGRVPEEIVATIARRLAGGTSVEELTKWLGKIRYAFIKSSGTFEIATESGEHDPALLRLQLARGDYWRGLGDGTSVDIARQLALALPDVPLLVSLAEPDLERFVDTARAWPHRRDERLTVIAEPLAVTQWAQDNGKAGTVRDGDARRPATIVPRYASKRSDASEFIPGDSWLADGLARAGHDVFQSPLLFQGGNLLAAWNPASRERVLLIAESEIHRNTGLGLTAEQVRKAFEIEFGVDRAVVLPTVAFHLDYDLSVRSHGGRPVAFVNDTEAAVRIVLELGVAAIERAAVLSPEAATSARDHLAERRDAEFVKLVGPAMWKLAAERRAFPMSVARQFSTDAADSGVGGLQRFLTALDWMVATTLPPAAQPAKPRTRAYLASYRRTRRARRELQDRLERLGFRIEPIPSLAFGDRSLTHLNGTHLRGRYLMPVYGGFFEPLDRAAATAFRKVLGPKIEIVPIRTSESQRRSGAVHCSVAVYPE